MDENALHRCSRTVEGVHIGSLHAASTSIRNVGSGVHMALLGSNILFVVTIEQIAYDERGGDGDKDKYVGVRGGRLLGHIIDTEKMKLSGNKTVVPFES